MDIDPNQSANVVWLHNPPSTDGRLSAGHLEHFSHLRDAVKFIVENKDADIRESAWIIIDAGPVRGDEIDALYRGL